MKFGQNQPSHPLPTTTSSADLTLYLIREELKSEKFFQGLHKAGIDDIYYQPRLGKAILMNLGMDDGKDETFHFYYNLIEKRAKKIKPNKDAITKQALKVYDALVEEKRKRENVSP